ncbi:MAG: hypothetical protein IJ088_09655 [Clostridia bacterium]|nr:hypothetical protein [Clostridia bacterium]
MAVKSSKGLNTPYDSAFKSIVKKCPRLALFLINEMFFARGLTDELYDGTETVEFLDKELPDLENEILMMDMRLSVTKKKERKFHMECQSTADGTVLLRMARYETGTALDEATYSVTSIRIKIDDSGIVFLRSTKNTPEVMEVTIEVPQGGSVSYRIPVVRMQDYSPDLLIQKKLFLLLPFVFFNYEKKLKNAPNDKVLFEEIRNLYDSVIETLKEQNDSGVLTTYEASTLYDAIKAVFTALGKTNQAEQEVENIMGGRILEFSADKYYNEGRGEGLKEGYQKGRGEGLEEGYQKGRGEGLKEGIQKGRGEGLEEGAEKMVKLFSQLVKEGKNDEMARILSDQTYRNKLYKTYEIS